MTRQDLLEALLVERYGIPTPEYKPPRLACDHARCDRHATDRLDGWDLCHQHLLEELRIRRTGPLRSVS